MDTDRKLQRDLNEATRKYVNAVCAKPRWSAGEFIRRHHGITTVGELGNPEYPPHKARTVAAYQDYQSALKKVRDKNATPS